MNRLNPGAGIPREMLSRMAEAEAQWRDSLGSGAQHGPSGSAPGHIDLEAAEPADSTDTTLGPEAARWAQSLLEVARFELARADDKASTLFRFYGVVAALSIGLLAGRSWSPTDLEVGPNCCSGRDAQRFSQVGCTSA